MKKNFIEPDIQRLKVNLHENIANSGCPWPSPYFIHVKPGDNYYLLTHLESEVVARLHAYEAAQDRQGVLSYLESLGSCVVWINDDHNAV